MLRQTVCIRGAPVAKEDGWKLGKRFGQPHQRRFWCQGTPNVYRLFHRVLAMNYNSSAPRDLGRFGFNPTGGGVHTARTMMFTELALLLDAVPNSDASAADYRAAIVDRNCLGKRSVMNRKLTAQYLLTLYGLDPSSALFSALRSLWARDPAGRPLLALECACARDPLLRQVVPFVLDRPAGAIVTRDQVDEHLNELYPRRFSRVTCETVAKHVNATLTDSGHLTGRAVKTRSHAIATAGTAAYALLLGYLEGARGTGLFETDYVRLLDCSTERVVELASDASAHGWIVFKHVADVYEVSFPGLLTPKEMEWVHEQS